MGRGIELGTVLGMALALGCQSGPAGEPDGGVPFAPSCDADGRCVYVVSALHVPREGGPVPGLDLDGRVSDESDPEGCLKPDFVAPDGRAGVDNQFATLVPNLESGLGESIDGPIRELIASGELLLVVELADGESGAVLEMGPAELSSETGEPALDSSGALLAGQTFVRTEPPHVAPMSIRASVVEAPVGDVMMAVPFDATTTIELPLREVRLRMPFVDGHPTTGTLAGRLWIDDLLVTVEDLPPDEPSLVRTTLERQADLDPNAEGICQSISIAFAIDLVPAQLAP